jgi:SAM-dependent methyltransferase
VLEHVPRPAQLIEEIARVLAANGVVVLSAPLFWEEHEIPYDFTRFTRYGLAQLFTDHGFAVDRIVPTSGALETLAQLTSVYVLNNLRLPFKGGSWLVRVGLCMPMQITAVLLQRVLPDRGALYLDSVVVARKAEAV